MLAEVTVRYCVGMYFQPNKAYINNFAHNIPSDNFDSLEKTTSKRTLKSLFKHFEKVQILCY